MAKKSKADSKECPYCGRIFWNFDSPRSFKRMVTCGAPECMGRRRAERLRMKKDLKGNTTSFA
jgi:hypothetical protein